MDCGGRSPQAISLKFLLDRWNCLETIMQCFGCVFFFPLKDFQSDSVSVYHSYFSHVRDRGGQERTEQKKKKIASFFFISFIIVLIIS